MSKESKEISTEEQAKKILKDKEQKDFQELSDIITQALQKYGYSFVVQHNIVLQKNK